MVLFVIFIAFNAAQLSVKFFVGKYIEKAYQLVLALIIFMVFYFGVVFLLVGTPKEMPDFINGTFMIVFVVVSFFLSLSLSFYVFEKLAKIFYKKEPKGGVSAIIQIVSFLFGFTLYLGSLWLFYDL